MENLISQNSKQVMNSVGNSQERVRPENWVEMVTEHEYDYTSGNPAVYVGTYYKYNKYNCGSLYGMWVDLTSFLDYDDFMEFCHLLHIDEEYPEFMYQDYENFSSEWYSESCFDEVTFDKILEYGNMDEEDRNMFDAFTDNYGESYTIEDVRERFKGKWDSEEEFAKQLLDDCYPDIPEFVRRYFDIEQFARDLFAYDYTFCDGYVFSDY